MSATSKLLSPGLYHIFNVANDNISADDGLLTSRLLDDARVNSVLEPAVVCNIIIIYIMRLFQEQFLYTSTDG